MLAKAVTIMRGYSYLEMNECKIEVVLKTTIYVFVYAVEDDA